MISPSDCVHSTVKSSLLSDWTTLRIGGPADVMCFPRTIVELRALLAHCRDAGTAWRMLGRGSNLLVRDGGVRGIVVNVRAMRWIVFGEGGLVRAGAGLPTSVLLAQARARGLGGLESIVGYPATVGGVARMNAGGKWGYAGDRIESVTVVTRDGDVREVERNECGFAYRTSALAGVAVAEVAFRLPQVNLREYGGRIAAIIAEKSGAQPLSEASAGCVFRNPPGESAGRLVQECGLKGLARGAAQVSEVHGNFVVNRGGATAADVLALIDQVREGVERRAGVQLELEVEVW